MKEQDLENGQVNRMIGTALGYGVVGPQHLLYFLIIGFFCLPFIFKNPAMGILLFAIVYGFFWMLVGNDPRNFMERWRRPKKWLSEEPYMKFNKTGIAIPKEAKRVKTTYRIKGKNRDYHHIERQFNFITYLQIELDGKKIGCYINRKGLYLMFIFAWEVNGYDPSITAEESYAVLASGTNALNSLPNDIDLKCHQDITRSCDDYLRMQADLLTSRERDILSQELIKSRAERAKELTKKGRFLHNKITILAKYRVPLGGEYAVKQTWMDDFLSNTQPLVGMILGKDFDSKASWEKVIDYAYHYAYQKVNSMLSSNAGFGMKIRTMTVDDLWSADYLELHEPPVPEVPQYIVYNHCGLQDPVINNLGTHTLGVMFEAQRGVPATPVFDRHYAYLQIKQKYAAFVRIGQIKNFPADKGNIARGYKRYLWNILGGTLSPLYDCRIVSELTPDLSGFEQHQLDRIISNSVKREALAAKKQTVDVIAMKRREQAIEARDLIEESNIPYWSSLGIWVYRDSLIELDKDVNNLIQKINESAAVERVSNGNSTEQVWFQTWRFEWEAFLTKPNHHRQKYISFQAVPGIPTIKVRKVNSKGILLTTRELSSPLYLNIAGEKNHTAIIAKSGTGKSILMFDMLLEYLFNDYVAVIFDFPSPDGTSTYTILISLLQRLGLKAAYHNVRESKMNIIEMPNLRHIRNETRRKERWEEAFQNHIRLLCAIVMGTTNNPDRELIVKSLLTNCYASFHADESITKRYLRAIDGGFGSAAYQEMPILEDFVNFADKWFANYIKQKKERISVLVNDTIDIILTQLQGILQTSLGASINGISSFNTNVNFLVIGLTGVAENLDSLIYAMSGLNVLYRSTLSAKRSLLGTDEGTILYKFPFYARETGIIPVHGRKWGCNFLLAAQEIKTVLNSVSGNEIFTNLDNIFCGHIEDQAKPEILKTLNFREEIIEPYSSEAFKPNRELSQSYWYLKRGDQHLEVTHSPSDLVLAIGATDPDEDKARKRVMKLFPDGKIAGLKHFGKLKAEADKQGLSMDTILPEVILDEEAA
jgi:hypothetical protein